MLTTYTNFNRVFKPLLAFMLTLVLTLTSLWAIAPRPAAGDQPDEPHIRLEKNPTYYDDANVEIAEVTSYFIDQSEAWDRYQSSKLDTITPPSTELEYIKRSATYGPQLHVTPSTCTISFSFSFDVPPFDNPLVRAAFAAASDRERLIREALSGDELPALTLTAPGNFGHIDGASEGVGRPYSPTLAAQLLADSGYVGDSPISLMYPADPVDQQIAEVTQQIWYETLGVTVNLQAVSRTQFWDILRNGSVDERPGIFRSGWCSDYPDAHNWHHDAILGSYGVYARYDSPNYASTVNAANVETDTAARLVLYKQAEIQLTMTDTALVPLYYPVRHNLTRLDLNRTYSVGFGEQVANWNFSGTPRPVELAWGQPDSLDPDYTWQWDYVNQLFLGLTRLDENGNILPELATEWAISSDGRVYTFTMRDDAVWTDGNPISAHDVVYSILRTLAPDNEAGYAFLLLNLVNAEAYHNGEITDPNLVGVEALDDTHVRFTLIEPSAYFLSILALPPARPLPQWVIDAHGDAWTKPENIVSNGPYSLAAWQEPPPELEISVNYAHDWISIRTEPNTTVNITVTDPEGATYSMIHDTDDDGGFATFLSEWQPEQPNIRPGDIVTATAAGGIATVNPVGEITGHVDANTDTILGTIQAPWFAPGTLHIRCDIWGVENGPDGISIYDVAADGGTYECDFSGKWDIRPQHDVAVSYFETDGDQVINVFSAPWMRVNYGHDWVGANYPSGHLFEITIYGSDESIKATAQIESEPDGGWGSEGFETQDQAWTPSRPDIEPNDRVHIVSDDGYDNIIQVGEINGNVDIDADSVGGTVFANWLTGTLDIECHAWGAPEQAPDKNSSAMADGSSPYLCQWNPDTEWDILPGQDVAVMYLGPDGDRIINVFQEAAPDVRVEKYVEGSGQVMPGGPVFFTIRYRNDGDATAESILITDTLPADTAYVSDTSGVIPTIDGDHVNWMLGPLEPGAGTQFRLVLSNSAQVGDTLRNEVEINTLYDRNDGNNHAEAEASVSEGQPDLYVNKYVQGDNPTPGQTFLYHIDYGNNGPVASGAAILTDTLPAGTSVVSWFSDNGYDLWSEISADGGQLVLKVPSIPGNWGDRIFLRLLLDGDAEVEDELVNTVEIVTEDDSDTDNNSSTHYANVNDPRWDVGIDKDFGNGQLVPGGEVTYNLRFENQGNMAADMTVTDVLPAGTILVEVRREFGGNNTPFPPDSISGRSITWDIGEMEPGEWYDLRIRLRVNTNVAPDTILTNCAEIIIDANDTNPENDRACVSDAVRRLGPNLRISKKVGWSDHDRQLEYQINVENVGTTTLEQVTVTDTYPVFTTFNGDWWHWFWQGLDFEQDDVNRQLIWTFERLEPNWSTGMSFRVELDGTDVGVQGLAFTNTVEIPVADDVYPGDNTATAIAYSGPDLFAEKWVSEGEIMPGERITFTMHYGNDNEWPWVTADGTTSRITDRLPEGMAFVKALRTDGTEYSPFFHDPDTGLVIWNDGSFNGDDRRVFFMVVDLDDNLERGDILVNRLEIAQIPQVDIDANPANNTFTYSIQIPMLDLYLPMLLR